MRLLKSIDFKRTFAAGRRLRCSVFTITVNTNAGQCPRLGLAISRRHAPRAVDRNRIKRVVRENFRTNAMALGPLDIVVQATTLTRAESNGSLSRKLDDLWRKLK